MLHQFVVKVAMQDVEQMIEKLNAEGIYYTSYETPFDVVETTFGYDYFVVEEREVDLHIYAEEVGAGLPESYFLTLQKALSISKDRIRYELIDDADWESEFEEIDLDNGWTIAPASSEDRPAKKQTIAFDSQGAFGTGLHATTQDCLRIILERNFHGQKIADLGTGSGILSIAAQLKGAERALAFDIEPVRDQIQYNASLNDVNGIEVLRQNILDEEMNFNAEEFDCIFINIGGEETLKFIERQRMLERYDRSYLISGLVEWSAEKALAPFIEANYTIKQRLQTEEWVTVWLDKRDKC